MARLVARVEEAAATGPPWAWPNFKTNSALQAEMCASAAKTGFYEPLHETAPPPPPGPPAPPPGPPASGPTLAFEKDGKCLSPDPEDFPAAHGGVVMGACDAPAAAWQVGWVRGHPSLESRALGSDNVAYCLNSGQVIGNSSCHSTPLIRTCSNGIKPQPKGGNPLGCGFSFDAEGGLIRALTCGSGAATCVGSDAHGVALVGCGDASALGWTARNVTGWRR